VTDIDARFDGLLAATRAECTTLRRSLGQRFRKIERDSLERFVAIFDEHYPYYWWMSDSREGINGF